MKITSLYVQAMIVAGMIFTPAYSYSADLSTYDELKIKNRASRNYTRGGTVLYNYEELRQQRSGKGDIDIGNITTSGNTRLREIHNLIEVDTSLHNRNGTVSLGNIATSNNKQLQSISNTVEMKGSLKTDSANVRIGEITIKDEANLNKVRNRVSIRGGVDVD